MLDVMKPLFTQPSPLVKFILRESGAFSLGPSLPPSRSERTRRQWPAALTFHDRQPIGGVSASPFHPGLN